MHGANPMDKLNVGNVLKVVHAKEQKDFIPFKDEYGDIPTPARHENFAAMQKVATRMNSIEIVLKQPGQECYRETIYKYRVNIDILYRMRNPEGGEQFRKKDLHSGINGDIPSSQRRCICYAVIEQLVKTTGLVPMKSYVYDRAQILYSHVKFLAELESATHRVMVADNKPLADLDTSFFGSPAGYEVELQLVEVFQPSVTDDPKALIQFLEIATSMMGYRALAQQAASAPENRDLGCFNNTFYFWKDLVTKEDVKPFQNDPRLLVRGIQKSVRMVRNSEGALQLVLQFESRTSPFFPETTIVAYLASVLCGGRVDGQHFNRNRGGGGYGYQRERSPSSHGQRSQSDHAHQLANFLRHEQRNDAADHVKNVVVRTTHLNRPRYFAIHGLSREPIGQLPFVDRRTGDNISVVDYFRRAYNLDVNPELPAVERKERFNGKQQVSYYPMECLHIVKGQRVPLQKQQLRPNMSEIMTRECQQKPVDAIKFIELAMDALNIKPRNIFLRDFGVGFINQTPLITTDAYLLPTPLMVYANNQSARVNDEDLTWKMDRLTFKECAPDSTHIRWCIVDVARSAGDAVQNFARELHERCQRMQLRLAEPQIRQQSGQSLAEYERTFRELAHDNVTFAFFVARNKNDASHIMIKYLETKYSILTQQVAGQNVRNVKHETLGNIVMKTNLKLGGVNQVPRLHTNIARDICRTIDPDRCMYMGLGFSGSGPVSLYERQSAKPGGSPSRPSAVALVYTIDRDFRMNGKSWYYETSGPKADDPNQVPLGGDAPPKLQESFAGAKHLRQEFAEALRHYVKASKQPPAHIFVYRNGCCEGDLVKIHDTEVAQLRAAIADLGQHLPFTYIVVREACNIRLFRNADTLNPNDKPPKQNVRAGTLISRSHTHPRFTEFILQSHRTIQGTGKAVCYTVVADEGSARLSAELLANLAYVQSFAHGIVNSPVSTPATLYSANALAYRAQRILKFCADQRIVIRDLSADLQPRVGFRFWA